MGTLSDLETLIKAAKDREQYIILELDPSHTSIEHPWFKRSIEREEPFSSYYVWADAKITSDGRRNPPNNWVSYNFSNCNQFVFLKNTFYYIYYYINYFS